MWENRKQPSRLVCWARGLTQSWFLHVCSLQFVCQIFHDFFDSSVQTFRSSTNVHLWYASNRFQQCLKIWTVGNCFETDLRLLTKTNPTFRQAKMLNTGKELWGLVWLLLDNLLVLPLWLAMFQSFHQGSRSNVWTVPLSPFEQIVVSNPALFAAHLQLRRVLSAFPRIPRSLLVFHDKVSLVPEVFQLWESLFWCGLPLPLRTRIGKVCSGSWMWQRSNLWRLSVYRQKLWWCICGIFHCIALSPPLFVSLVRKKLVMKLETASMTTSPGNGFEQLKRQVTCYPGGGGQTREALVRSSWMSLCSLSSRHQMNKPTFTFFGHFMYQSDYRTNLIPVEAFLCAEHEAVVHSVQLDGFSHVCVIVEWRPAQAFSQQLSSRLSLWK